ncbi:hypothetical protein DAEQUDRAFT_815792 [Daedalea quercina L-15889]|uniref:F-box domain-containing protein n=1 Tax=Daedalea quercina L-15889 TaxID=1314783 RepID=A0A165KIR7_9APHY|nr:hypothetical protein DAEQUDRAFT_815792 [Daedalea quercina L-15889]
MPQKGLRSCALVCRAWYQASICVLYRDITISSRVGFDSLAEITYKDARAPERLARTNSLRVGGIQREIPVHVVPLIFARPMPNVRRLVFYSTLHRLIHSSFFITLPLFKSVTTLELFRFKLRSFSELRRVISAFPRLDCLKLGVGALEVEMNIPPLLVVPQTRIRLKYLVLGWGLTPSLLVPLIRWLAGSSACATLAHLAVWRGPSNIALQANELLTIAGKTLVTIHEWDIDTADDLECFWPTALRGLYSGAYSQWQVPWQLRDRIAVHCTFAHSPRLRNIRFELHACTLDDSPNNKWLAAASELESVLRTVRGSSLCRIKIRQSVRLTRTFLSLCAHPRLFYAALSPEALLPIHRVMRDAAFGSLEFVEFSVDVEYSTWEFGHSRKTVSMAVEKFSSGLPHLFAPWHEHGILQIVEKINNKGRL